MAGIIISEKLRNELETPSEESHSAWYIQVIIFLAGILSVGFFIGFAALLVRDFDMLLPIGVLFTIASVLGYFLLPKDNDYLQSVLFALLAAGEGMLFGYFYDSAPGISTLIVLNVLLFYFLPMFAARLLIPGVIMLLSMALIHQDSAFYRSGARLLVSNTLAIISLVYSLILILSFTEGVQLVRIIPGKIAGMRAGLFLAVFCACNPINLAEALFQEPSSEPLWQTSSFIMMAAGQLVYSVIVIPLFLSLYPQGRSERRTMLVILIFTILLGIGSVRLMLALQLLLIAHIRKDHTFMIFSTAFVLLALSTFYYSLHITLLVKSLIMIATGIFSLTGWQLLRKKEAIHG